MYNLLVYMYINTFHVSVYLSSVTCEGSMVYTIIYGNIITIVYILKYLAYSHYANTLKSPASVLTRLSNLDLQLVHWSRCKLNS